MTPSADAVAALREFVERIDPLDPAADRVGTVELRIGADEARLVLRAPVARALADALRAYQDPRDRGRCSGCGARRLDHNFLCPNCGRANGVFGQLVMERAAAYAGDPAAVTAGEPGRTPADHRTVDG